MRKYLLAKKQINIRAEREMIFTATKLGLRDSKRQKYSKDKWYTSTRSSTWNQHKVKHVVLEQGQARGKGTRSSTRYMHRVEHVVLAQGQVRGTSTRSSTWYFYLIFHQMFEHNYIVKYHKATLLFAKAISLNKVCTYQL